MKKIAFYLFVISLAACQPKIRSQRQKEYFEYAISSFFLGMLISEILSYGNFFNLWQVGIGNSDNPRVFLHHTMYSMLLSVTSIFLLFKIID